MWQMDALRRLAAGELAEVVGPSALNQDRESRRLRLSRIAEAQAKTLTPETKAIFAAYARGVNYYLETHRGRLPLEFTLLNYSPRPWRIEDTLLAALADVSHAHHVLARRNPQAAHARKRRQGKSRVPVPGPHRNGSGSGFQRLGGFRRAHRQRQADSGGRSASGLVHPFALVPGASQGRRWQRCPGRDRRFAARHSRGDRRSQPAHRVERDESRIRRPGSVSGTNRRADRPLSGERPGTAGGAGARLDRREGTEAVAIGHLDHRARTGVFER